MTTQYTQWIGRDLKDRQGDRIGEITDIYMDEGTGKPEWLAVKTGWFGTRVSFVPLSQATSEGQDVKVPYEKDQVKDAPNAESEGQLSHDEEARLYRHYGFQQTETRAERGAPEGQRGSTDDAMTRSEEELRISKASQEKGRVRLRRMVDTEHVSERVPVTREEARVEREPITADNVDEATSGPGISEAEHEEVLHEERVVSDTEAVPKERVRLTKEQVTDEEEVEADLRKERIEEVHDEERRPRGRA